MEYLENFKSRFENYLNKTREVPNPRECLVENLVITRSATRTQFLVDRRKICNKIVDFSPGLQQKTLFRRRQAKMEVWKAEKLKKKEEQRAKIKPVFRSGARANIGFPRIDKLQAVRKSFAPSDHVFKAPDNVKGIDFKAAKETGDTFDEEKAGVSSAPSFSLHTRTSTRIKQDLSHTRVESIAKLKETTNKVIENKSKQIVTRSIELKGNKENVFSNPGDVSKNKKTLSTPNKRQSRRKTTLKADKDELLHKEYQTTPTKNFGTIKESLKKENKDCSIRSKIEKLVVTPNKEAFSSSSSPLETTLKEASYFHSKLNNEISRLTVLCETWNAYKKSSTNLTEDAKDLIDVAVGQANLLMCKKFQQFRKLIDSFENGCVEEKPVTCEDLQGFWDMIFIQVENLNTRFNRLTEMKNQNWQETIPVVQQKIVKKKGDKTRIKSAVATSSLRAAIQDAKKRSKSASTMRDQSPQMATYTLEKKDSPAKDRRRSRSLETRRSSQNTVELLGSVSLVKTPARSILKKPSNRNSKTHIYKTVLFKDYNSDTD